MKIHFDNLAGEKLANLLLEISGMVESGSIKVGFAGLSPDSAEFCDTFYECINTGKEIWITDSGLKLTT